MNGNDIHVAWRDEQIEMLRNEIDRLKGQLADVCQALALAEHRAEQAEDRVRNLMEEVSEWQPTP